MTSLCSLELKIPPPMQCRRKTRSISAFSLIELIVMIGVIGILASIAIPMITEMHDSAEDTKNRRNAQTIAMVCSSAQSAGLDFYVTGDKAATIQAIVTGGFVVEEGVFKSQYFGSPNVNAADQIKAAAYLTMDDVNSHIVYTAP